MQFAKSELYGGFRDAGDVLEAISQGVAASGFTCVSKSAGQCNFGAMTVNNLPIVFEVKYDSFQEQVNVLYKYAVPPLKDLETESIRYVLTGPSA